MLWTPSEDWEPIKQGQDQRSDPIDLDVITETVAHEFNNVLNNISLHLAILEQGGIPAELRSETAAIRHKCRAAAAMIKSLQQYSRSQYPLLQPTDLNCLVRETVSAQTSARRASAAGQAVTHSHPEYESPVRLELPDGLPQILGNTDILKRLLEILLHDAATLQLPSAGPIVLRTRCVDQGLRLCFEYPLDVGKPEPLQHVLGGPQHSNRGQDSLHYAICKTLAKRLQAALYTEVRPDGGASLVVEFQPADRGKSGSAPPG